MDLGSRLKALREQRGLSLVELARSVGMSESALRKVEESDTGAPSFPNGVEIARALRCWPDELARERPHRSDIVFEVEGVRVELRLRVHGDHETRGRALSAVRGAVATIAELPRDEQQERLKALEAELQAIYAQAQRTLAEIRALREGVSGA